MSDALKAFQLFFASLRRRLGLGPFGHSGTPSGRPAAAPNKMEMEATRLGTSSCKLWILYNVMQLCITYKKYTQVIPHISTRGELNWLKMPQARLGRHRSTTVLPRSTWDMQWTELQRVTTSTLSEINLNRSEHCKRSSYD